LKPCAGAVIALDRVSSKVLSLRRRLVITAGIVLLVFLGATGLVLDRSFVRSAHTAQQDRLDGYLFAMLASAEFNAEGMLVLPEPMPEPRLRRIDSGLIAFIVRDNDRMQWRSQSMLGMDVGDVSVVEAGLWRSSRLADRGSTAFAARSFGVTWVADDESERAFTLTIAESERGVNAPIQEFRANLWAAFASVSLLLVALQGVVLSWGLRPLKGFAHEVQALEQGTRARMHDDYPAELAPLANNLNALLDRDEQQLARHRDALSDLAHSLKTPLALLATVRTDNHDTEKLLTQQIDNMNRIVEYQLTRARSAGPNPRTVRIELLPVAKKIGDALSRLYHDKAIDLALDVSAQDCVRVESGDLMEILGNVLDNAFKWAHSSVRVSMEESVIRIDDDGPGVPAGQREAVLRRGERADEQVPGHGIGLATVASIIAHYGGSISIEGNPSGGARILITFPT